MINFYEFYNKTGLDNEHYGPIIEKAHNILNNKSSYDLKLIEHIIKKSPQHAYYYATYVIGDRWPEAEPVIVKDPKYAYFYTRKLIKGRWEEAEPIIIKSHFAGDYAIYVMKERWLEAEPYIKKDAEYWQEYCDGINIR